MGTAEIGRETTETLGAPALEAAGLRLWIHGRQFPSAHDPDEGNLLSATIRCEADGLIVRSEGAGVRASDIARWARDLRELLKGTTALARVSVKKRVLEIAFHQTEDLERVRMRVAVVPAEGVRGHAFEFDLFRNEIEDMVRQCDDILRAYPVRGASLPSEG